ncbi:hypothetical protein ACNKHS_17540 [Shigella flexneri]
MGLGGVELKSPSPPPGDSQANAHLTNIWPNSFASLKAGNDWEVLRRHERVNILNARSIPTEVTALKETGLNHAESCSRHQ